MTAENERLSAALTAAKAENEALREALKPFADEAKRYDPPEGEGGDPAWASSFNIGQLRAARNALGGDNG